MNIILLTRILFTGVYIFWLLISIIYIDSLGSLSQSLPQNIIGWLAIIILTSAILFYAYYKKIKICITLPALCYISAIITLSINLFIPDNNNELNFWYLSGIIVGITFYISGLQIENKSLIKNYCIYSYILTSSIQSVITIYQYFFEADIFYLASDMRSNGLSQQINILSVNMTTAYLLTITVIILSLFSLKENKHEKIRVIILAFLLLLFTITIVILQSVTTWLLFFVLVSIFTCLFIKKNKNLVISILLITLIAIFIGVYLLKLAPNFIDNDFINQFHLKQMLRFSINLFLEKPYEAWEQSLLIYNNYEKVAIPFLTHQYYIISHSHNGILLWLMKNSIINILSLSLLITGSIYIIYQSIIKYKKNGNGYSLAIILDIIPLIVYAIVEYPFVLSVFHWGNIILFLSFSDISFKLKNQTLIYIDKRFSSLICLIISIIGVTMIFISAILFNYF
ncbi:O-antigen ligase domain-containing protein [Proteus mirabilis]|uniref:O-antigen ligase domain-containing protein n=1 Tax=Proteus mirabilis TaxID=584 RepID=UPI0021821CC6|nr:O-antigen ligase domain-containing protein [Proteus mirabilis]MDF7352150.1 O-antigen ligase domain-containing protein [Proteus mirabilis]MDW8538985.1 O-antigen ligase domain-containing protein [Proteus mirabilis]WFC09998.1 O-antigen ligase domain-containing protein [Proteus mirabilis]